MRFTLDELKIIANAPNWEPYVCHIFPENTGVESLGFTPNLNMTEDDPFWGYDYYRKGERLCKVNWARVSPLDDLWNDFVCFAYMDLESYLYEECD